MARWNQADLKNDAFFLKLVKKGYFSVTKKGVVTNTTTGNIIGSKPLEKAGGYHRVSVRHKGKTKSILVHRLVWLVYKGPIPEFKQVNHKDGNKSRNYLSNFALSTNSENTIHSYRVLGKGDKSGSKHVLSKLTDSEVRKIRRIYRKGNVSQKELGGIFGVSQKIVYNVVNELSYINV